MNRLRSERRQRAGARPSKPVAAGKTGASPARQPERGAAQTTLPLVSVVIPAYNHGGYVQRCLDSVAEDGYANKEVVIIDDGSTDDTNTRIREWIARNETRLTCRYISRENRGLVATLNELVRMCTGEYLVVLASDDYLLPGGIGCRVEYLRNHAAKDAVIGDCIVVDGNDKLIASSGLSGFYSADKSRYHDDRGLRREIILNWSVPGPVLMVRRSIYGKIGGYDPRLCLEDWDMYLRMAAQDLLGFVDHPVSAYRVHPDSTCRSDRGLVRIALQLTRTAPSRRAGAGRSRIPARRAPRPAVPPVPHRACPSRRSARARGLRANGASGGPRS